MAMLQKTLEAMLSDPSDPRHGTAGGYTNYACRCDRCKQAHREIRQKLVAKKRARG